MKSLMAVVLGLVLAGEAVAQLKWMDIVPLGAEKWVASDDTHDLSRIGGSVHRQASAYSPLTKGIPAQDDGNPRDRRLSVRFSCSDLAGTGLFHTLSLLWIRVFDDDVSSGYVVELPSLSHENIKSVSHWVMAGTWWTSIGSAGAWMRSAWEFYPPGGTVVGGARDPWRWEDRISIEDAYVFRLMGQDRDNWLGKKGSGLTSGEVARLQTADVLMFRLPYRYFPDSAYKPREPGQKFRSFDFSAPRKRFRGEQEWHVSLAGSREAIQAALEICKGTGG